MAITISGSGIVEANIADGAVSSDKLATGIDATKLADGTVTSTELQYINSLSSNAQTQISAADSVTAKVIGATYDMSTASGTQDITGFGFQPSAVHAFMFINVTDDWCHSFTDFTDNRAMHAASTTTAVVYGSVAFGLVTTTADNVRQTANPVTAISDGIRLTWVKGNSPTVTLIQYFIGYK